MTALSDFPITRRFPPTRPDELQLYSFPTPNGVKVSIMLEETGLPYEAHTVNIMKNETWTPDFLALNPNGKIPAIIDPAGPGRQAVGLFESGAILVYLAEKIGKLLPTDPAGRYETLAWLFFQMASVGPMFGQVGFFHKFAGKDIADKRPLERYVTESKRLLGVMETRLVGRRWIMGDDYTIADISLLGWVRGFRRLLRGRAAGRLWIPAGGSGLAGTLPRTSRRAARPRNSYATLVNPRRDFSRAV